MRSKNKSFTNTVPQVFLNLFPSLRQRNEWKRDGDRFACIGNLVAMKLFCHQNMETEIGATMENVATDKQSSAIKFARHLTSLRSEKLPASYNI